MSLWSAGTLQRFLREGEDIFNAENNCILDRVALDIVEDTAEYTLPDDTLNIKRLTWLGYKIDPVNQRDIRLSNITGNETGSSRPFGYIFNNIGQLKIKFYPTPNETIATITTNLWGSEIPNRVIVEYWRASDYSTKVIPAFFSSRLCTTYQYSKLYAIEGRGQNIKSAQYFNKKWIAWKERYAELLSQIETSQRRTIIGNSTVNPREFRPHLPLSQYGTGVREGE